MNSGPAEPSAFEQITGATVALPRMLPHTFPDGSSGVEYQYVFLHNGERIGGLGLFGTEEFVAGFPLRERIYTLDLSPDRVVTSILELKQILGAGDDDFTFLRSVAQGLVSVFMRGAKKSHSERNVAITNTSVLSRTGVSIPDGVAVASDGTIVLADLLIPVRSA